MIIRDIFLLILLKNICCDTSSERSDEGSQHMVSMRIKKNYHQILSCNNFIKEAGCK